jgi:hypothetical protein
MEEQHPNEDGIGTLAMSEGVFNEAYIRDWNRMAVGKRREVR